MFCIPRQILWATRGCSSGITNKPHSSQLIYGGVWSQSPWYITICTSLWKRFVDDTFVVIKSTHKEFLKHINSMDEGIQFTFENTKADGSIPFLDTLVIPQSDGSLITTVFWKPTHTDQYLQWDSHHTISAKYSVISTLFHQAKAVCSTSQKLHEEHEHLQKVLTRCKYPRWALNRIKDKISTPVHSKDNNNMKIPTTNSTNS